MWLCLGIMPYAAFLGCAEEPASTARNFARSAAPETPPSNLKQVGLSTPAGAASGEQGAAKAQSAAVPRKIIYDATIDLVVDSLNGLETAVADVVKRYDGFLAGSDLASQVSTQRTATWKVRVPVERFEDFVRAISRLGEVRSSHVGSQDVTEEYFDIEARIRNKQEEEKRLLKHLSDSTGKLEDILKVEAELTRVRGEIEQMQGRLRFLANRADLSTITITATELKNYTPPQPVTLATQISTTFFGSLNALIALGESLLLVAVALVPWLPLIVIALFVAYRSYRASLKAAKARMIAGATPSGPVAS
jgi:hypothetical protein